MIRECYKEITMHDEYDMKLVYFLLTENVREEYCDLKVYGAEIQKTYRNNNGKKETESNLIKNLFFRKNEAEQFLEKLVRNSVTPMGLKSAVSEHIGEQLKLLSCEG